MTMTISAEHSPRRAPLVAKRAHCDLLIAGLALPQKPLARRAGSPLNWGDKEWGFKRWSALAHPNRGRGSIDARDR